MKVSCEPITEVVRHKVVLEVNAEEAIIISNALFVVYTESKEKNILTWKEEEVLGSLIDTFSKLDEPNK